MDKDQDTQLFRDLMQEVTPLKKVNKVVVNTKKPEPKPKQFYKDKIDVVHDMLTDHYEDDPLILTGALEYLQSGIQKRTFKKLKQGKYPAEDEIDLHSLKTDKARELINDFINQAIRKQYKCVRIIHGKGYRSHENKPVLKPLVNSWLRQKSEVLAFCSAQQCDGGTGAVNVLLKRLDIA